LLQSAQYPLCSAGLPVQRLDPGDG
jgi:hypothetical protein